MVEQSLRTIVCGVPLLVVVDVGAPVTRDHKIRIAVSNLSGEAREKAVLAMLKDGRLIQAAIKKRLCFNKKYTNFTMRLTGEEYCRLHTMAQRDGKSMTRFVRAKVGI